MAAKKKHKIRTEFRKNRTERARSDQWTRRFHADDAAVDDATDKAERIGKSEQSRRRTVLVEATEADDGTLQLGVDLESTTLAEEVACELPQDRRAPLLAYVVCLVESSEEIFVEHDLYSLHVENLRGAVSWGQGHQCGRSSPRRAATARSAARGSGR